MTRAFLIGLLGLIGCGAPLGAPAQADPSARLEALAEQVLIASGADPRAPPLDSFARGSLATALKSALPDATSEWQSVIDAAVEEEIKFEGDDYFKKNVDLYASRFTEAELQDMLTFYNSPGGKALVAQLPAITAARTKFKWQLGPAITRMVKAVCEKEACAGR